MRNLQYKFSKITFRLFKNDQDLRHYASFDLFYIDISTDKFTDDARCLFTGKFHTITSVEVPYIVFLYSNATFRNTAQQSSSQ